MFSEPMLITYDTVQESMARTSFGSTSYGSPSVFETSDGEFRLYLVEIPSGDRIRFEVLLERTEQDADGDPFTGSWMPLPNRFGFVFEVNSLRYNSETDLPLLQSALTSLVDATFRSRLIAGEK